ncbi:MAG: hypothetical protein IKO39_09200 [Treponema sp.]|nr:hypothetical protein [Treponema sp.]
MSKKVWNNGKILLLLSGAVFAQSQSEEIAPPSVSMPTMPSVSMPSVGDSFYTPGRSDFYSGWNPNRSRQNQASQAGTNNSGNQSSQSGASSATAQTNQQKAQLQAEKASAIAKNASSALNTLSADDISSLSNLGAFSQLSGLLGRGNSGLRNQLLASQNTVTANTVDSATLKQILSELTELKNKINRENNAAGQVSSPDISGNAPKNENISLSDKSFAKDSFSTIIKKEPKILRFNVNGYDLLETCRKIYFSEIEADGTFLLTGDRKYMSEGKVRSETFYFYFHAKGNENGITKYTVTPAVSQDYENQYSYLYQLAQKNALSADRTGNLVTLRINDGVWKMDLLLSLDK